MKKTFGRTTKILNIIYCFAVLLFLLDCFTGFDIKNQTLKSFVFFTFLIGTPAIFLWNLFTLRIILILYPILFLVLIIIVDPMRILLTTSVWKTITIGYEHKHNSCKTIEYQMQDIGALGFNRREVEVINLTPLFRVARELPNDIDENEWILVNKQVFKDL